jgi:hypothetical protein
MTMEDVDALDAGGIAWWRDPDPESSHATYMRMHSSATNRSKIAVTERMLAAYEWRGQAVVIQALYAFGESPSETSV